MGTGNLRAYFSLLATYDCEIPAFAGMVRWGTGIVGGFGNIGGDNLAGIAARRCRICKKRFLLPQEWFRGGRGIVGEYGIVAARRIIRRYFQIVAP